MRSLLTMSSLSSSLVTRTTRRDIQNTNDSMGKISYFFLPPPVSDEFYLPVQACRQYRYSKSSVNKRNCHKCVSWKFFIVIHYCASSVIGYRIRLISRTFWPFWISIQRSYVNEISDFPGLYSLVHFQSPHWVKVQMHQEVPLSASPLVSLLRDLN